MDRAGDDRTVEQPEVLPPDTRREEFPAVWVVDLRSHRVVRQKQRLPALSGRDR